MWENSEMADKRGPAAEQLTRLLYLLPAASRDNGLSLTEAADRLDVDVETVLLDLQDLSAREFYHPAGGAEDLRVEVESDHVHVQSGGKFVRPRRLSPREALATHLALRRYAAGMDGETHDHVLEVADRIASALASMPVDDLADQISIEETGDSAGPALGQLRQAIAAGLQCEIVYVTADGTVPTKRSISPYVIAVTKGKWYVIGFCESRSAVRVFRVDRIINVRVTEQHYAVPDDFRAEDYVHDGQIFRSDETCDVVVNYRGRAASMMSERTGVERHPDGTVSWQYAVAEPDWAVRHVLSFGGEAVIEKPTDLRERLVAATERIRRLHQPVE
jgi:proteasome accessory factor C